MGSVRSKVIDKNRYSKRYPLIRAPARSTFIADSEISIEVGSIYFDNAESGSLSFEVAFPDTNYQIIASPRDTGADTGNVNVFVSALSASSVTVQSSSNFTGYVDIFAVKIV